MANERGSDWQKLIRKCIDDEDYRARLSSALASNDDKEATRLLDSIGVAGTGAGNQRDRLVALKAALQPMSDVLKDFSDPRPIGVAP